ncbi:MAG: c-type cytochrome [Phycisphaera sp. RhM]|nr:c-type cytochrome [Phycisphaera sp. RhM]
MPSCNYLRVFVALAICCAYGETESAETVSLAPHTFTIPDGYELKRVAAPPLVKRPIHMCFDESGVLYVTDSSGNTDKAPVQLKDPQHRVLRLVDTDGDGVFDESTVFADTLPFPEGILVHDGSVYVGAPPHIWKLRDTDGDHVADERTEWFDGGSIEGCGNDMHGPYLGPDGFFYWCKGAFAPQKHELSNGRTLQSSAAHIYRARPDGSQLEMVITGGMNNPVGLAFSETGERFLSGTFFDLSQPGRRDGILHAIYGGTYGKENPRVLTPHPNTGGLLPILTQLGPAAPSGMMMARHPNSGLSGDLLCTEFNTRRISRHQLTRSGSSYSAETTTFIESDNTDFHPTDVIEDADGSLLVADTGSWYMICCPTSKVAKPDILGAIYRLQKAGAFNGVVDEAASSEPRDSSPRPLPVLRDSSPRPLPVLGDPRGLKLDWNQPQVGWLSDQRPAVVKRAIDALANEDKIDDLRRATAKVPAVWSLHRIQTQSARQTVRDFLSDENSDVRAAAIHSVALWRDRDAMKPLIELLSDDDRQLRRLAAMALGRIGSSAAVKPLLKTYSESADAFLKHAVIHAVFEIGDSDGLPTNHPVTEQVRRMQEIDQRNVIPDDFPEIQLANVAEPNPEKMARQKQRLDELATFLPTADAQRGAKLFSNRDKSKCIICHLKGDQGVRLGPDLTRIGAIRSERDLLEAVVYPSASIARYHEIVNVLTEDGRAVSGLLVKETMDKIFLASAAGVLQPVRTKEIEHARYSDVSLMPEGLDRELTPQEIADLVAYLKESTSPDESAPASSEIAEQPIPPHREMTLPGLHAYAQKSIAAGNEIKFRVSSSVPYELSVVQLGPDPENRDNDPVLTTFSANSPRRQPIHPGSYVHIDNSLPSVRPLTGLTLECWIRPFALGGWQGLINQHDYPDKCGIGLFISDGQIAFMTDGGGTHNRSSLHQTAAGLIKTQRWHHVAATWDGKVKRVFIDGKTAGEWPYTGVVRPGKTALRIGAYGSKGAAENFYNGDIAMVSLYDQAITLDQIQKRVADRGLTIPKGNAVLACWPFTEERGTRVADAGVGGRHGRIINRGTWMIGGPSFDAAAIDRHDASYDPMKDPKRGHGLRLASDELYNARWEINHRFGIPADAKSGVYAGRFDFEIDGKTKRYFTTFIVRRPESRPKAPLAVLMSTNTWLAYNSAPFPINHGRELTMMGTGGLPTTHPDAATYSGYRDHRNGQPTYKIGMKLPWPAAGPNKTYINQSYSHLMRGERFLHLWLDQHGYHYDVITDRDLDRNPEVLDGYQAVVINGHSEYWSARAYDGLDSYLKAGGDAVVLSGNTMFWRVSFDETDEFMEVRKYGTGIGGRKLAQVGELYHSHDFRRGSLMRFCGYPAWKVVGLTCIGWGGAFKPYQVDQPEHFLFNTPHQVGLKKGDAFGFISKDMGAVGHEFDVRLSTLQRATADSAIKGLVEPKGIVTVASSNDQRRVINYNAEGHKPRIGDDQTIAEIIYWERPTGGRVFHTGSIATAWGVYHDEHMSKLLKNVLHHFGVEARQETPRH